MSNVVASPSAVPGEDLIEPGEITNAECCWNVLEWKRLLPHANVPICSFEWHNLTLTAPIPLALQGKGEGVKPVSPAAALELDEVKIDDNRNSSQSLAQTQKLLLDNVSGQVFAGETVALMGASGAGKSTLLKLLAGGWAGALSSGRLTGMLLINGQLPTKIVTRHIASVAQEDILLQNLTVRETLVSTALLRRQCQDMTREQQLKRVDETMEELGLVECQHTLISLVSGGQRRRVTIGIELLSDPSLLLCDEPTSGLDHASASSLIQTFRTLANRGRSIVVSIHQPTSAMYETFDKVILMVNGRVAYFGHASCATAYFAAIGRACRAHWNVAEFLLSIATDTNAPSIQHPQSSLANVFDQVAERVMKLDSDQQRYRVNNISPARRTKHLHLISPTQSASFLRRQQQQRIVWVEQFQILLRRSFQQKRGEILTITMAVRILSVAAIASIVWFQVPTTTEHIQDRIGALFFPVSFWFLNSMLSSVAVFPAERRVIQRERRNQSYRLSAYFAAKSTSELPVLFVYPTLFVILYYFMVGFNTSVTGFLMYWSGILLLVACGDSVGLLVSNLVQDPGHSMIWCNVYSIVLLVLAGFYVRISAMQSYIKWMTFLNFPRFIFGMVSQSEFRGIVFDGDAPVSGESVLHYMEFDTFQPWQCALIVVGMTFVYRFFAFRALEWRTRLTS